MGILASIVDKSISGSFSSDLFLNVRGHAFDSCSGLTGVYFPNATSIGGYAFDSCSGLTEAEFPNATSIGRNAFNNCSSLTSASFPNATNIDNNAFQNCINLTEVSIPNATRIGSSAFSSCKGLTEVFFPEVTSIGSTAFNSCSGLTNVSFPKATSTGSTAFNSCSGLTSVSFPVAISIDSSAFSHCSSLTSVSVPNATEMGNYAFQDCSSLTSVSLPKVTSIGSYAFQDCSSLTSVSLPEVTRIDSYAFYSCSGPTGLYFPKVTSIDTYSFQNCANLTEVEFPEITSIGRNAFNGCSNLTTIYVGTNTSTVCTLSSISAFTNCTNLTSIYVPLSLVDSYKSATNWSNYADKIKAYEQLVECVTLSITADDVAGKKTSTTVYYTAECTYSIKGVLQPDTKILTGTGVSSSFAQNTSTTDTVQREVSFTFLGKTATTTITQGVWINQSITVTTEGISSHGWVTADSKYNVTGYDVYMSNSKGANSKQAVMKLECVGYTDLTIYIRSYAQSNYDYTIASTVNASTYPKAYNDSTAKAHTRGHQKSGTSLSDYTAVNYTGLKDNDIIYIVFTKDSSSAGGDDRGFVLIPKQ